MEVSMWSKAETIKQEVMHCQRFWLHQKFCLGGFFPILPLYLAMSYITLHREHGVGVPCIPWPIYVFLGRHTGSGRCQVDSLIDILDKLTLSIIIKSPRNCCSLDCFPCRHWQQYFNDEKPDRSPQLCRYDIEYIDQLTKGSSRTSSYSCCLSEFWLSSSMVLFFSPWGWLSFY